MDDLYVGKCPTCGHPKRSGEACYYCSDANTLSRVNDAARRYKEEYVQEVLALERSAKSRSEGDSEPDYTDLGYLPKRSVPTAALLSLIVPGAGQIYYRKFRRGAIWFLLAVSIDWSVMTTADSASFSIFLHALCSLFAGYGASRTGRKKREE